MAEIHIDSDWKKQAQEEKRRLAEEAQKRAAAPPSGAGPSPAGPPTGARGATAPARAVGSEMPPASLATLVQSLMTQILLYLGEYAPRGGEPMLNLDMAKHMVDTLAMLEEKTKGNLTEEENRLLDTALYETRMRYVQVASQFIGP